MEHHRLDLLIVLTVVVVVVALAPPDIQVDLVVVVVEHQPLLAAQEPRVKEMQEVLVLMHQTMEQAVVVALEQLAVMVVPLWPAPAALV